MEKYMVATIEFDTDGILRDIGEVDKLCSELRDKVYKLKTKTNTFRIVEASEENTSNASK